MIVISFLCFAAIFGAAKSRLPDKVFCADENCSEPLSIARTILKYQRNDPDLMSFPVGVDATIYAKSAGSHQDLWQAEIGGKRGFVPSKFLREQKVFVKNPTFIRPIKITQSEPTQTAPVLPDKVLKAHEVVDGTTIYNPSSDDTSEGILTSENILSSKITPLLEVKDNAVAEPENEISNNAENDHFTITSSLQTNQESEKIKPQNEDDIKVIPANDIAPSQDVTSKIDDEANKNSTSDFITINGHVDNTVNAHELTGIPDTISLLQTNQESQKLKSHNSVDSEFHGSVDTIPSQNGVKNISTEINNELMSSSIEKTGQVENTAADKLADIPDAVIQNISVKEFENAEIISEDVSIKVEESKSVSDSKEKHSDDVSATEKLNANPVPVSETGNTENKDKVLVSEISTPQKIPLDSIKNIPSMIIPPSYQDASEDSALKNAKDEIPMLQKVPSTPHDNDNVVPAEMLNDPNSAKDTIEPSINLNNKNKINLANVTKVPDMDVAIPNTPGEATQNDENVAVNTFNSLEAQELYSDQKINDPAGEMIADSTDNNIPNTINSITKTSTLAEKLPDYPESLYQQISQTNEEKIEHTLDFLHSEQITEKDKVESININHSSDLNSETEPKDIQQEPNINSLDTNKNDVTSQDSDIQTEGFIAGFYNSIASIWFKDSETSETNQYVEEKIESVFSPEHEKHHKKFDSNIPDGVSRVNSAAVDKNSEESGLFYYIAQINKLVLQYISTPEQTKALFAAPGETCMPSEYCDAGKPQSNRLITFLIVTATSVLIFTLGYYYIDNKRQDGRLVGMVNTLQRDLLCCTKECEILKDELHTTKGKLAGIEDNSFGMDEMVQSLKAEIEELKLKNERLRNSLDDNEKLLRVSENTASELQNTLGELENTLGELLSERGNSEEQVAELNEKIQALEEELISVSRDRDEYKLRLVSSERSLEELKSLPSQVAELSTRLQEAKGTIDLHQREVISLKELLKKVETGGVTSADVKTLVDQTELTAKLSKALEERSTLESKYEVERKCRQRLEEEVTSQRDAAAAAQQRADEVNTRLDVLGKYFQQRESELLKELSTKESLWLSKQGESISTVEKIEALQKEVQQYKEMCESARRELAELEAEKRSTVAALEARAHEAWLEARAARRDAQQDREQAAALRRKMASLAGETRDMMVSPHQRMSSPLEPGNEVPPPLPPLAFLPPPLLPPLPRPPPLGRLPSPLPPPRYGERRYSPDSRYSPESRFSPESRYSPDSRYSPTYTPHRRYSRERYYSDERSSVRQRNGHGGGGGGGAVTETETDYSPTRTPRRRRYSGPSSGSGCSSESEK